jgi:hypothetical protein
MTDTADPISDLAPLEDLDPAGWSVAAAHELEAHRIRPGELCAAHRFARTAPSADRTETAGLDRAPAPADRARVRAGMHLALLMLGQRLIHPSLDPGATTPEASGPPGRISPPASS